MIATVKEFSIRVAIGFKTRTRVTSVLVYAFITLLPQLASGCLAILYTRAFSSEEYANYGIFAAVFAFIATILDFGLPSGMFRNFYRTGNAPKRYFSSILTSSRLITLAALPAGAAALYFLWDAIGVRFPQKWAFIPVLLAIAWIASAEEMLATICRALERPVLYVYGRLVHGTLLIASGYLLVFVLKFGVMGSLLALFVAECCALVTYAALLRRQFSISAGPPDWPQLRETLQFGFPIVPNRLAGWARLLAVRPVLAHVVSAPDVGVFSFASSLASLPAMLSSGVEMALGPVYYRRREEGDVPAFNSKLRKFAAVYAGSLVPVWALMIFFGPDVVRLISGRDYAEAGPICSVLLCATYIRMQMLFLNGQIQFLRKTWILPGITIPCGLLALVLTVMLAKSYGVMAAAWVTVGIDLLIFILLAWVVHHFEGLNYPIVSALVFVLLLCGLAVAGSWLQSVQTAQTASLAVGLRLTLAVIASCLCIAIWIWPNRTLIQDLIRR